MKIVYTENALKSLEEAMDYISKEVDSNKIQQIKTSIFDKADQLIKHPYLGQEEELLSELGLGHRRLIKSHYKIIYRVVDNLIIVTDIFDFRQDPEKMKR